MWDLSPQARDQTCVLGISRWILNHCTPRKVLHYVLSLIHWALMVCIGYLCPLILLENIVLRLLLSIGWFSKKVISWRRVCRAAFSRISLWILFFQSSCTFWEVSGVSAHTPLSSEELPLPDGPLLLHPTSCVQHQREPAHKLTLCRDAAWGITTGGISLRARKSFVPCFHLMNGVQLVTSSCDVRAGQFRGTFAVSLVIAEALTM